MARHLFESTLFCLLVGGIASCLRRQSASMRHTLWLVSVLKFLIPTAFLAGAGAWIARVLPASVWVTSIAARVAAWVSALFGAWTFPEPHDERLLFAPLCVGVWAIGSAFLTVSWAVRLRSARGTENTPTDKERAAFRRAQERLRVRMPVELHSSAKAHGPALIGIFRPSILIPHKLSEGLTDGELESVLCHEVAHACRYDNLASALVHLVVCLFWFHPLLWLVETRLAAERERACDELVVGRGTSPKVYLAGLLKVCRFSIFGDVPGLSAMRASDLDARARRILSPLANRPLPLPVVPVLATLALLVTAVPFAGGYCETCVSRGPGMTQSQGKTPSISVSR